MLVIEELHDGACRWPVAEFDRGEFLFCGEPTARDGRPYCRELMALAYRKSRTPRRAATVGQCDRQKLIELSAATR